MYQLLIYFALFNFAYGQAAQLMNLTVTCDENGMNVNASFDLPFNGIIYSKNYYKDENCRFIKPNSNLNLVQFQIKKDGCGLLENLLEPLNEGRHEYRSTIIIQKHPDYQNRYDLAKSIICTWFNLYRTSITQKPIIVGSLNEDELITSDNSVEIFIDVRRAENANPFKKNINGIMQIGQQLTVSVFLIDYKQLYDVRTSNCYLYDRKDFIDSRKINLTSSDGCSTDTLLFDGFKKIDNVQTDENILNMLRTSDDNEKILKSTIILTGNLNVIKFPEVTDIFVSCNIEICKGSCNSKCHPPFKIDQSTTTISTSDSDQSSSDLKQTTTYLPPTTTIIDNDPDSGASNLTTTITSITTLATTTEEIVSTTTSTNPEKESTTLTTEYFETFSPNLTTTPSDDANDENRLFSKRRIFFKNKSFAKKLDYNHNGLIMNNVDNSTILFLARIQAREQKRSLSSSKFKMKPTRSIIDNYLKNRLINRSIKQQNYRNSVIIDQPIDSLAKITFNENLKLKTNNYNYKNRKARLLFKDQDTIVLDHLVLSKSFVIKI